MSYNFCNLSFSVGKYKLFISSIECLPKLYTKDNLSKQIKGHPFTKDSIKQVELYAINTYAFSILSYKYLFLSISTKSGILIVSKPFLFSYNG